MMLLACPSRSSLIDRNTIKNKTFPADVCYMERNEISTATNIHHVGITVPDLDEVVDFFVECVSA